MGEETRLNGEGTHDADGERALQTLFRQLVLGRAAELARAGRHAHARTLFSKLPEEAKAAPASLDLLARISAQQGDLSEAEKLWTRAQRLDPSNPAYEAALRRVESMRGKPSRRSSALRLIAVLSALALVCVAVLIVSKLRTRTVRPAGENVDAQASAVPQPAEAPTQANPTSQAASPPEADFAESFKMRGVVTTKTPDGLQIEFEEGLFSRDTILKRNARRKIREVAALLQQHGDIVTVEVIGMTDTAPMPRGARYRDNIALGLERARIVYDYLRTAGKLKAQALTLSSRGEQQMPHAGTSGQNHSRRRSVILRIKRQR